MIKCNVTVCGVIGRDASIRTNKEGKTFLVFPLRVMIPDTDGKTMPIVYKRQGCQQRYCRKGGFQISKWFPHRGFGDNVSQTPW